MRQYFINNFSKNLILFFAGWGCDEYEFEHLKTEKDVLILYDYKDLNFDFDFSKYGNIDMITFSAGVFIGSIFNPDFKINRKIAISGNPYLFDEKLGLSKEVLTFLRGVDENNCDDFAKNYLVMTDDEYKNFNGGKRSIQSCREELTALQNIYKKEFTNIKDCYDVALIGDSDPLFNPIIQKDYYKERCKIIKNARHNIFFRIKSYEDIFKLGGKCTG